jgi:hypothetical protein
VRYDIVCIQNGTYFNVRGAGTSDASLYAVAQAQDPAPVNKCARYVPCCPLGEDIFKFTQGRFRFDGEGI